MSNYQYMLHFFYVALPFLVFAIYRSLTNLEPFSKLIHQHQNNSMSHSVSGVLWFGLHFWNLIIFCTTRCSKSQQPCPLLSLLSLSLCFSHLFISFFHHLFFLFDHFFSSQPSTLISLLCYASQYFSVSSPLSVFANVFCSPSGQHFLGSAAAATWTRETTCSSEGAVSPAEVSARPDPVFTAPAPAAACRAEEAENSFSSGHAGEGSGEYW